MNMTRISQRRLCRIRSLCSFATSMISLARIQLLISSENKKKEVIIFIIPRNVFRICLGIRHPADNAGKQSSKILEFAGQIHKVEVVCSSDLLESAQKTNPPDWITLEGGEHDVIAVWSDCSDLQNNQTGDSKRGRSLVDICIYAMGVLIIKLRFHITQFKMIFDKV